MTLILHTGGPLLADSLDTQFKTAAVRATGGGGPATWYPILTGSDPIVVPDGAAWQVFALATFSVATGSGPAVSWNAQMRMVIGSSVGHRYVEKLTGPGDDSLGSVLHAVKPLGPGTHTVTFEATDDGVHTALFSVADLAIVVLKG